MLRFAAAEDEGVEALAFHPHGAFEAGHQAEAGDGNIQRAAGIEAALEQGFDGRGQPGALREGHRELEREPRINGDQFAQGAAAGGGEL